VKCCRSTPRCRNCPARQFADERVLRAIGIEIEPLPPHLRGVPPSLHKYEPLLKKSWLEKV
jgi:hypothetical protein